MIKKRLTKYDINTAIGLVHAVADQDMEYMKHLVIMRMEQHFPPKKDSQNANDGNINEQIKIGEDESLIIEDPQTKLKAALEEIAQLKIELKDKNNKINQLENLMKQKASESGSKKWWQL
jgi:hypothetical protein